MTLEAGKWYLILLEPDRDSIAMAVARLNEDGIWRDEDERSFSNVIGWQDLPSKDSFNPWRYRRGE